MNKYLFVMICGTGRTNLTIKCIESIHESLKYSQFTNIEIYLFDNGFIDNDRLISINKLLNDNKITHYSYDTKESSNNCFYKMNAHYNFLNMMKMKKSMMNHLGNNETYYLICDNDIILRKGWDTKFLTVADSIENNEPNIRYITKWRGGTSDNMISYKLEFEDVYKKNKSTFDVNICHGGGGSAFWFMNWNMFSKIDIDLYTMLNTYKIQKKHDSSIWKNIKNELKEPTNHNASIILDDSYILHFGTKEMAGSICTSLLTKTYIKDKKKFDEFDKYIGELSLEEVYEKYKDSNRVTEW